MTDTVKILVYVKTDKVGSMCQDTLEYPREEWTQLTPEEREADLFEAATDMMNWGWEEL